MPSLPHEVPAPPSLRKIIKSLPYPGHRSSSRKKDSATTSPILQVYPELSTLSSADIATDLDYLFQHRRPSFDPHSHRLGMSMTVSGPQMGPAAAVGAIPQGGFDGYAMSVDGGNASPFTSGSRIPPPIPASQYQHHLGQQPLQPFPSGPGRPQHPPPHLQPPSHNQTQFPLDPEVTLVAVGPGQHQYFNGSTQSSGGTPGQIHHLGLSRPISPVHIGSGGGKQGGWTGEGRVPGAHTSGGKQTPEYGWMNMQEGIDDIRDRDRDNKRERERERDRHRERSDRDRERDQRDLERDRERTYLMQQQQPHRHVPPHQHQHPHNSSGQLPHNHQGPHHHHRHHHHFLHHHHPQQLGGPSTPVLAVSPGPSGSGSALSPHVAPSRDFEPSRPYSGPSHPPEVLNLSAPKQVNSPSHWKRDELPSSDYRERGRHDSTPSSTLPGSGLYDERERPLQTPFVMASSQAMSSAGISGPNGQSGATGHSPRLPWSEEHTSRVPPSSSFSPLNRGSPLGLSPPRTRPPVPRSPSSSFPGPTRSPTRYVPSGPPLTEPLMHSLSSTHGPLRSAPPSPGLKAHRLSSPPPTKRSITAGPSRYSPPPSRLSGPGRTSTPTALGTAMETHSSVHPTPAPSASTFNGAPSLMTFNSPSRPPNGNSAIHPTPKINAVQMVDGP